MMDIKKKSFFVAFSALIICLLLAARTQAAKKDIIAEGICGEWHEGDSIYSSWGDSVKWQLKKDGTMILYGTGRLDSDDDYEMPWKKLKPQIKKVVIEEGVENVYGFAGCENLESIQWADTVNTVDNFTFSGCISLTEVHLPGTVKNWGMYVFEHCKGLKKVTVDEDICFNSEGDYNGQDMFYDCTNLEELVLPDGLTVIPPGFYADCTSLHTYNIPKNIIYWGSFPPNTGLKKITLPDSVKVLGAGGLSDCSSMEEIILPEGLEEIHMAFYGCTGLKTITIPSTVKKLKDTFAYCDTLESVEIPDSVEVVEGDVFYKCTNLKSVCLSDSIMYLPSYICYKCTSLKSVTLSNNLKEIRRASFADCISLRNIEIPDGVTVIWDNAFDSCKSMKSVKLPKNLKRMRISAFRECSSLKEIEIPAKVKKIEKAVFEGCKKLKTITILSKKLTYIGEDVFEDIHKNATIYVPKGKLKKYKKLYKATGSDMSRLKWKEFA